MNWHFIFLRQFLLTEKKLVGEIFPTKTVDFGDRKY